MVRLAGIEPTTPWFVAKYSIQLSYSRTVMHLNLKKWYAIAALNQLECKQLGSNLWAPAVQLWPEASFSSIFFCTHSDTFLYSMRW
jgi:hypothetical protein